ncbi:hypothetical protein DIPPA_64818, partial [Diplonema papillatum]
MTHDVRWHARRDAWYIIVKCSTQNEAEACTRIRELQKYITDELRVSRPGSTLSISMSDSAIGQRAVAELRSAANRLWNESKVPIEYLALYRNQVDDTCIGTLLQLFEEQMSRLPEGELLPKELHLSHNSVTKSIANLLRFAKSHYGGTKEPLFMRLEYNSCGDELIAFHMAHGGFTIFHPRLKAGACGRTTCMKTPRCFAHVTFVFDEIQKRINDGPCDKATENIPWPAQVVTNPAAPTSSFLGVAPINSRVSTGNAVKLAGIGIHRLSAELQAMVAASDGPLRINISENELEDLDLLWAVLDSAHVQSVQELNLSSNALDDAVVEKLGIMVSERSYLHTLVSLDLSRNRVTNAGLRAMISRLSSHPIRLQIRFKENCILLPVSLPEVCECKYTNLEECCEENAVHILDLDYQRTPLHLLASKVSNVKKETVFAYIDGEVAQAMLKGLPEMLSWRELQNLSAEAGIVLILVPEVRTLIAALRSREAEAFEKRLLPDLMKKNVVVLTAPADFPRRLRPLFLNVSGLHIFASAALASYNLTQPNHHVVVVSNSSTHPAHLTKLSPCITDKALYTVLRNAQTSQGCWAEVARNQTHPSDRRSMFVRQSVLFLHQLSLGPMYRHRAECLRAQAEALGLMEMPLSADAPEFRSKSYSNPALQCLADNTEVAEPGITSSAEMEEEAVTCGSLLKVGCRTRSSSVFDEFQLADEFHDYLPRCVEETTKKPAHQLADELEILLKKVAQHSSADNAACAPADEKDHAAETPQLREKVDIHYISSTNEKHHAAERLQIQEDIGRQNSSADERNYRAQEEIGMQNSSAADENDRAAERPPVRVEVGMQES